MNYESGNQNMMEMLKQTNKKSLNGIEVSLGETRIISIPTQVREAEMELLRTAVNFQPELYKRIDKIPTRTEMDEYMEQAVNIDTEYYTKMVNTYREELAQVKTEIISSMEQTEKNNQEIQAQMTDSIKQGGRNQESFLNSTLQKGSELEQTLAAQVKKVGILYAVKWIAISILSSAASTLLLHLWLK